MPCSPRRGCPRNPPCLVTAPGGTCGRHEAMGRGPYVRPAAPSKPRDRPDGYGAGVPHGRPLYAGVSRSVRSIPCGGKPTCFEIPGDPRMVRRGPGRRGHGGLRTSCPTDCCCCPVAIRGPRGGGITHDGCGPRGESVASSMLRVHAVCTGVHTCAAVRQAGRPGQEAAASQGWTFRGSGRPAGCTPCVHTCADFPPVPYRAAEISGGVPELVAAGLSVGYRDGDVGLPASRGYQNLSRHRWGSG